MSVMSGRARRGETLILGMGCRFPGGAGTPEALWQLVREGGDAVGPMPPGRFDPDAVPIASAQGGWLDGIDRFDAGFFGLSPREARRMDPQHRLLLEVVHEALADAGIAPSALRGRKVGVWVGLWSADYEHLVYEDARGLDFHGVTGTGRYSASGRIAFVHDFRGPAVTVDTGCSAGLVALDAAWRAVDDGSADLAVVAAANLVLQPFVNVAYTKSGMLTSGGRCRFGAAAADGYVRAEGAAALLLGPADEARRARRTPRARIRAVAVNADGFANGQLATPSQTSQEALLTTAWERSGLDPSRVPYVEAHGTGTRAGDPVEVGALGAVLGKGRPTERPLLVGSVKSNIGHTEACAGLAGVIKAVLALEEGEIPPSLGSRPSNPEIDFEGLRVEVVDRLRPWPEGAPRWAGVNSFGITGTNAHVVLEGVARREARGGEPEVAAPLGAWPVAISGAVPEARAAAAERLLAHLESHPTLSLADLSWTTTVGRDHHRERSVVLARDRTSLVEALEALRDGGVHPHLISGSARDEVPRVAFLFSGQGSQWEGMARSPGAVADAFHGVIGGVADTEVAATLRGDTPLEGVERIQPALGAVQIAVARQLMAWGLDPQLLAGHSMGEAAAAAVAGALTDAEAMDVLQTRSALLSGIAGEGAMALVDEPAASVAERLRGREERISIAAVNGPRTTVISGEAAAVDALLQQIEAEGVFARRVRVDVASHSPQTDPLLDPLRARLAGLRPREGEGAALYSTVTGALRPGPAFDAEYWADNLRRPVQLDAVVRAMLTDGVDLLVEVAPHPILSAALADIAHDVGARPRIVCTGKRDEPTGLELLHVLAEAHVTGVEVAWSALAPAEARAVALPHYPWQRERYWIAAASKAGATGDGPTPPPPEAPAVDDAAWVIGWHQVGETPPSAPPPSGDPLAGRWWVGPAGASEALRFAALVERAGGEVVGEPQAGCVGTAWFAGPARECGGLLADATEATVATLDAVRALVAAGVTPAAGSWWVTTGVQNPPGRAAAVEGAAQGAAWGVVATIQEEHPELRPHLLDVGGGDAEALARAVRAGVTDRRLADSPAGLFAARLQPATAPVAPRPVEPGGAWLVTGGLGALGRVAARQLVQQGVRHVILTSRTPLPPRRRWQTLAADHPAAERVAAVRALEAAGAAVYRWTVDLTDAGALDHALDQWEAEGRPPIAGVVHCAGALHAGLAVTLGRPAVEAMLGAKVGGVEVFRRRLPAARLVLTSSLSSLLPRVGQAHYAAANAVLDAVARSTPDTLSLSWGVWEGVGLVAGEAGARVVREMVADGLRALSVAEGAALFAHFRHFDEPHLVVAPIDRAQLAMRYGGDGDPFIRIGEGAVTGERASAEAVSGVRRPADTGVGERTVPAAAPPATEVGEPAAPVATPPATVATAPATSPAPEGSGAVDGVRRMVRAAAARILEMDEAALATDRPLGLQGIDSVMAMELRNALERGVGLRLPASVVWNHPTVDALAAHLTERIAAAEPPGTATPSDPAPPPSGPASLRDRVDALARSDDDEILRALRGGSP